MIRKSAAIATIVVLILVIAISIAKAEAHVSRVEVHDQQNVELSVVNVKRAGAVRGSDLAEDVTTDVGTEVTVPTAVKHATSLVAVSQVSLVNVHSSVVEGDVEVGVLSV